MALFCPSDGPGLIDFATRVLTPQNRQGGGLSEMALDWRAHDLGLHGVLIRGVPAYTHHPLIDRHCEKARWSSV